MSGAPPPGVAKRHDPIPWWMPGEPTAQRVGVFVALSVSILLAALAALYTMYRWHKWIRRRLDAGQHSAEPLNGQKSLDDTPSGSGIRSGVKIEGSSGGGWPGQDARAGHENATGQARGSALGTASCLQVAAGAGVLAGGSSDRRTPSGSPPTHQAQADGPHPEQASCQGASSRHGQGASYPDRSRSRTRDRRSGGSAPGSPHDSPRSLPAGCGMDLDPDSLLLADVASHAQKRDVGEGYDSSREPSSRGRETATVAGPAAGAAAAGAGSDAGLGQRAPAAAPVPVPPRQQPGGPHDQDPAVYHPTPVHSMQTAPRVSGMCATRPLFVSYNERDIEQRLRQAVFGPLGGSSQGGAAGAVAASGAVAAAAAPALAGGLQAAGGDLSVELARLRGERTEAGPGEDARGCGAAVGSPHPGNLVSLWRSPAETPGQSGGGLSARDLLLGRTPGPLPRAQHPRPMHTGCSKAASRVLVGAVSLPQPQPAASPSARPVAAGRARASAPSAVAMPVLVVSLPPGADPQLQRAPHDAMLDAERSTPPCASSPSAAAPPTAPAAEPTAQGDPVGPPSGRREGAGQRPCGGSLRQDHQQGREELWPPEMNPKMGEDHCGPPSATAISGLQGDVGAVAAAAAPLPPAPVAAVAPGSTGSSNMCGARAATPSPAQATAPVAVWPDGALTVRRGIGCNGVDGDDDSAGGTGAAFGGFVTSGPGLSPVTHSPQPGPAISTAYLRSGEPAATCTTASDAATSLSRQTAPSTSTPGLHPGSEAPGNTPGTSIGGAVNVHSVEERANSYGGVNQQQTVAAVLACLGHDPSDETGEHGQSSAMQLQSAQQPKQHHHMKWQRARAGASSLLPQPRHREGVSRVSEQQPPVPAEQLCGELAQLLELARRQGAAARSCGAAADDARVASAREQWQQLRAGAVAAAAAASEGRTGLWQLRLSSGGGGSGGGGSGGGGGGAAACNAAAGVAASLAGCPPLSETSGGWVTWPCAAGDVRTAASDAGCETARGQSRVELQEGQAPLMTPQLWPASGAAGPEGPLARSVAERLMTANPLFRRVDDGSCSESAGGVDSSQEEE